MSGVDLNLLLALDVLLAESSVAEAARKLGLSASAMSRTLARLRAVTADPLLVRAGRRLVPTPHAAALRERLPGLTKEALAMLQPATKLLDLEVLERTFTLRVNEAFVHVFAARLVTTVTREAPNVRLRFAPKPDKNVEALREGSVDLEIGVLGKTGPEVRVQTLFDDRFIGAVRPGHPLLTGDGSAERFADCGHVIASRGGREVYAVNEAFASLGLALKVVVVAPSFPAALAIACASDLVAHVTHSFLMAEQPPGNSMFGAKEIELPVAIPAFTVSQMWHPRLDADPAHRWLRALVQDVCRGAARAAP